MAAESDSSIAAILKDYIPKGDHDQVLEALDELDRENAELKQQLQGIQSKLGKDLDVDKVLGRVKELEGKLRARSHQDAFAKIADELGIDPDFRDDVFEMGKFPSEKDEPDPRAMKAHFQDWLDARESRKKYLKPAEDKESAETGKTAAPAKENPREGSKPRLHTEDDGGRGNPVTGGKAFRYRSENLSDPEWMRTNAVEYARAVSEGRAQKIG